MRSATAGLLACLALLGCMPAADQTAQPAGVVQPEPAMVSRRLPSLAGTDFAALVRQGVSNSPLSSAGSAKLVAAASRLEAERGARRPQVSAEVSATTSGSTVPVLSLRQILFDGGQSKERVALKEIEARGAWLTELSALSTRSFVAVEAIIGLQRDRKLQAQAELNSNRIQEIVDDLQSRFDGGVGSVADLLAGQGRSSNAQTELGNARSQVQLASTRWVEFFGFAPGQLPNVPLAPSALRGASMADVIANSPRMREQAEVTQARMRSLSIAQRSGRPTISAIVETDFDQGSFRDPVQARLGVSAPIYRGGAVKANVAAAEAALAESKANEEALQRELTRALSEALVETNSVKGRLSSARKSVEINTEALEAARGQFEIGRGSLLQILDALRELNVAQAQVIQLEADALSAEYAILATTGDILDVLGIVQPVDPTR